MALMQSMAKLCMPVRGTWRVIFARWALYVFAMLPGLMVLSGELNDAIGRRPYFQDLELPLSILDLRLLFANLFGSGTAILLLGVIFIWLLQLVWLGGATHLFSLPANQPAKKVFQPGWQYLGRFVRIAVFALLVAAAAYMGIKSLFSMLAARSELQDWSLESSLIDLNIWRVCLILVVMTLIGTFAFWIRIITVAQERRDLRRLPLAVLGIFRRRPVAAFLFQFVAILLVLALQGIALYCWRQSSGGLLWPMLWAVALLFASWVWQLRIRAALAVLKPS